MKKGYCEKCDNITEYEVKEREDVLQVRGKEYKYKRLLGYCKKCGQEIASNEITDENLKRMDYVFRTTENIIKVDEINDILIKYKIGKKPLSKLLGWGEITLTRYLDGDMPTKLYSDELYKLSNNIWYMEYILEKNKNNITERAYNATKNAIKNLKSNTVKNQSLNKIELIAEYIIHIGKEITPLALQKILYYAQGFYKTFFGEFLYQDDCEAWVHGPAYANIYEKYKIYGSSNIPINIEYDIEDILVKDEKELLDIIVKYFGYYNGKALEKMTHYESPWIEARRGISFDEKSNNVIDKKILKNILIK